MILCCDRNDSVTEHIYASKTDQQMDKKWSQTNVSARVGPATTPSKMRLSERLEYLKKILTGLASDPLKRRICAASLAVGTLLIALAAGSLLEANRVVQHTLDEQLTTHLQATGQSIHESLSHADYAARQARKQWLQDGRIDSHAGAVEAFPKFKDLISEIVILNKSGFVVASSSNATASNNYFGNLEFFRIHQTSDKDILFISKSGKTVESKITTLEYTRPILDQNHKFNGVVVIILNLNTIKNNLVKKTIDFDIRTVLIRNDKKIIIESNIHSSVKSRSRTDNFNFINSANVQIIDDSRNEYYWKSIALDDYSMALYAGTLKDPIHKTNHNIWVLIAALTLTALLILFYYTMKIVTAVQDRNKILQKLIENKIAISSANAMKSKFVASISHEFRTRLNSILGFSELIGMSDNFEKAQQYGKIVNTSATQLHQLVNTLLDLAKIEAGQMKITRILSDVRELCDSVASIHRSSVEKKELLFDIRYETDIPKTIFTDHIKLMQILNNLLNNAIKFTDDGAIFFIVSIEKSEWCFSIADTGIGMTPQQLKNIFTRFNRDRMDQFETTDRPGAGLGMALCKDLVELLDGTIDVYSERNVGTVVKIFLPKNPTNDSI